MLNQSCMPWINSNWLWYIILFIHYWIQFAYILLRILHNESYWSVVFLIFKKFSSEDMIFKIYFTERTERSINHLTP